MVKDKEAWHAAVHWVTESWTRLSKWTATNFHKEMGGRQLFQFSKSHGFLFIPDHSVLFFFFSLNIFSKYFKGTLSVWLNQFHILKVLWRHRPDLVYLFVLLPPWYIYILPFVLFFYKNNIKSVFPVFSSLLSCCSVAQSYLTLQPHGLQHARLPCPSLSPGVCSNSCPLSQWCHPTISSSVVPFSCPQSFPASGSFPVSWLFTSGGQSVEASAPASVLPMNIQGWFPLRLTDLISLLSKRFSKVFPSTTIWKHQFFSDQPSLWSNSHILIWLLEKP